MIGILYNHTQSIKLYNNYFIIFRFSRIALSESVFIVILGIIFKEGETVLTNQVEGYFGLYS